MKPPLPANDADRIRALHKYQILDTSPEEIFDNITRLASLACNAPMARLSFIDETREWFKSSVGSKDKERERSSAFCAHAIGMPDEIMIVEDAATDKRFVDNPLVTGEQHIRFYAGAPLVTRDGYALGTLCVLDTKPHAPTTEQINALRALQHMIMSELENRRYMHELEEAEEWQQQLLDNSLDIILTIDAAGNFTSLSNAFEKETGWKPEDWIGKPFIDLLHPDDVETGVKCFYGVLEGKYPQATEYRMRIKSGQYIHTEFRSCPLFKNGKVIGLLGDGRNITVRKTLEQEKQSASEILRRVVYANPAAISITAIENGTIIDVNPRFEEISGYTRKEIIGNTTLNLNIWVHLEQRASLVERLRKHEIVRDFEIQFRRKSGAIGEALIAAEELEIDGTRRMLTYTYDITERKRLEEQVRQSEELFAKAFHASPAWMMLVRISDMTILDINEAALERFGYARDEIVGRKSFETEAWVSQEARLYITEQIQNRKPVRNYVVPYRTREGNIRRQLVSVECIDVGGEPCALTVAVDITERLEMEEQLETRVQQRTAELAQTNAALLSEIEERKHAEEEVRKSEMRYRSLIEQASDGIITYDERGTILDLNTAMADMVGYTPKEAIGKNIADLIDPQHLKEHPIQWDAVMRGKTFIRERVLRRTDSTTVEVEVSAKRLPSGRIQGIVRDITERKKVENERIELLKEINSALTEMQRTRDELAHTNRSLIGEIEERRLAEKRILQEKEFSLSLIENASVIVIQLNSDGTIQIFNNTAEQVTGYAREELIGKNWFEVMTPRERYPHVSDEFQRLMSDGFPRDFENPIVTKAGQERIIAWRNNEIRDGGKVVGTISFGQDITEHRRADEVVRESRDQLRELAKRLQTIREEERKDISREIHDELGQALTGLKIDLGWLENRLLNSDKLVRDRATSMLSLIDRAIVTVQQISTALRPGMLDELGLAAAIEWQASEFERRTGITCSFKRLDEPLHLDENRATALFRIFQETLTNVTRHANATQVAVSLKLEGKNIILELSDDGRGINTEEISDPKSIGLLGMKERALAFDGEFNIYGNEGKGTTVKVTIPTASS